MQSKSVSGPFKMTNNMNTHRKSSPLVYILPILIAMGIVAGVIAVRYFSPVPSESKAVRSTESTSAALPRLKVPTGVPVVGFDSVQSTEPVSDLRQTYEAARDSVAEDFETLEKDINAF